MKGRTYGMSSPCPCDDCEHLDTCVKRRKTCAVMRHWEQNGIPLIKKGVPVTRAPDRDI